MSEDPGDVDEFDEYLAGQMKDPGFRAAYEAAGRRDFRTFRRDGIYCRRFQWWFPWGVTDWWKPCPFRGGDEWGNPSVCLVLPPFGCLVLFWRPGRLRTVPCLEERALMDDWQLADYAPCGYLYGGRLREGAHHHINGLCDEARAWLATVP